MCFVFFCVIVIVPALFSNLTSWLPEPNKRYVVLRYGLQVLIRPGANMPSPVSAGHPMTDLMRSRTTCSIRVKTGATSYVNLCSAVLNSLALAWWMICDRPRETKTSFHASNKIQIFVSQSYFAAAKQPLLKFNLRLEKNSREKSAKLLPRFNNLLRTLHVFEKTTRSTWHLHVCVSDGGEPLASDWHDVESLRDLVEEPRMSYTTSST